MKCERTGDTSALRTRLQGVRGTDTRGGTPRGTRLRHGYTGAPVAVTVSRESREY